MSSQRPIQGVNATRMEMLQLKQKLQLAEKGHDLLKQKLETLTNQFFTILRSFKHSQEAIMGSLEETRYKVAEVEMTLGAVRVREIAQNSPIRYTVSTDCKPMMGVEVPVLELETQDVGQQTNGGLYDSSVITEQAINQFEDTLAKIVKLAEDQSAIVRLAREIKSTKRRVNALKNIIIPQIEATVNWISLTLAEREREEFVRLKKIKKRLEEKE